MPLQNNILLRTATALICSGCMSFAVASTAPLEMRGGTDSDSPWKTSKQERQKAVADDTAFSQQYISSDPVTSSAAVAKQQQQQGQPSYISRLSQLEGEVRELRGQLEQQSHKMRQMISLQSKLFQDIDNRLDALVGNPNSHAQSPGVAVPRQVENTAPATKSPDSEQRAYQTAYSLLRSKQYAQAKHAMQTFINNYPDGEYTVNAHYWLGELSLLTGDNKLAATEFETVIKKYPASSKVSDAMLKVGLLHLEKGEQKLARQQFQQIVKSFPNSASANIAHKRLQTL